MEIKTIIKTKVQEHENILNQIVSDLDKLTTEMQGLTKNTQNENKIKFFMVQKIILKDKAIFHKAAIQVLKDLEEEIKDE